MPPHCDTLDGPVVKAATEALNTRNVAVVLPYVPKEAEGEVKDHFASVINVRELSDEARKVADRSFFETVVRLHREGEGEPFRGLKPAGLDTGPVITVAERAIETGDADELVEVLCEVMSTRTRSQLNAILELSDRAGPEDVDTSRAYVSAMLGLQVWAHKLFRCAESAPHEAGHHPKAEPVG